MSSSIDIHELARGANPATAAAILRQLRSAPAAAEGTRKPAGGVRAFHSIDRAALGGYRSATERRYAERLAVLQAAGEILGWDYEAVRVKLAEPVTGGRAKWFRVDFAVWHPGGILSFDEVKGDYLTDAGRERWRWLCGRFPRAWVRLWQWGGGAWVLRMESGKPAAAPAGGEPAEGTG